MVRFYAIEPKAHPAYHWAEYPERGSKTVYKVTGVRKCGDLISSYVWSSRMIDCLVKCGATGYSARPVTVLRGRQELRGYLRVCVLGKGGPLDCERSKVTLWKGRTIFGHEAVYMHEDGWDGNDLFRIPELGGRNFAVERVISELKKLNPTNVTFTFSTECSLP